MIEKTEGYNWNKYFGNLSKKYILMIIFLLVFYLLWLKIWEENERILIAGTDIIVLFGLITNAICYVYAINKTSGKEKKFWVIVLISQITYILGDITWNFYEIVLNEEAPFPGIPDVFYLACVILLISALVFKNVTNGSRYISGRLVIDITIVMVLSTFLSYQYLISPAFLDTNHSSLYVLVSSAYPITDLGLLFAALYVWGSIKQKERFIYIPMILGIGMYLITDSYFVYSNSLDIYLSGGLSNMFWMLSLMLIGITALYTVENLSSINGNDNDYDNSSENSMVFIPYMLIGVLILIILNKYPQAGIIQLTAFITVILLVIRQNLNILENKKLLKKLRAANEELIKTNYITEINARTDFLTGLYNRRCIEDLLENIINNSNQGDKTFSLFIIDIDWFKKVNDEFGHDAGDSVLIEIAELMKSHTRANEVIGRYGGEEFIGILPDTKLKDAIIISERLREKVENNIFSFGKEKIKVTISIGITEFDASVDLNGEIIKQRADLAMYKAKNEGRNRVVSK